MFLNMTLVNICLSLSSQAYCDFYPYKYILYDPKSDMRGFISHENDATFISFKGTSSFENWIEDLKIDLVPYKNGLVHKGFLEITQNLLNDTVNNIYECRNIILTGHSLGGAIALLMGIELNDMGYNVKTYTFGQPKIGDNNLNRMIGFQNYRFVHDKDIVPHLPPFPEYQHQCNEIFQVGNIIKKECNCNECSNNYKLKETNIPDHKIYLEYNITECPL